MEPTFFPTQAHFRTWLKKNSGKATELIVGYYKVGSGKPSLTWSQSVDEALCFGWIDGVRRSIDAESYCIRFTPRKAGSIWSTVNINKVAALTELGLMEPAGLAAFALRKEHKTSVYAYERDDLAFTPEFEERFKANAKAYAWFLSRPKSYQKSCLYWVMGARQEATRQKRMNELIADSEAGINIKPQRW